MRLTKFNEMVHDEFGRQYGESLLVDHVLLGVGGMTAAQAIEAGRDPREIWRALCADFEVPHSRW